MSDYTNLGEGANEVKYFTLILCPSTIKGKGLLSSVFKQLSSFKKPQVEEYLENW